MTKWLSHRMVERGIIKEEEQELYQFGIRNGMILLLNVVTALVIGLLTEQLAVVAVSCLLYTSPSPRDVEESRMPSSA